MIKSKFNVDSDLIKRTYDEIVFDSKLEMRYYRDVIRPKMDSGDIIHCELQKPYELQPKFVHDGRTVQPIKYIADFFVRYKDGSEEVIDTKGYPDTTAIIKRKMFWYKYPDTTYRWITWIKKFGGWVEYDEYKKLKREEKIKKNITNYA